MNLLLALLAGLALTHAAGISSGAAVPGTPGANDFPLFKPGTTILFQGDSITDGNRGRSPDPNHILGHGYAFLLAAKYGDDFADRDLKFVNKGVSGNKVSDLAKRWQADALDLKPDVLSILIGVNDLGSKVSAEDYEKGYDDLLAMTREALPKVKLILIEPFGLPSGKKKENWETYHADLLARQAVVGKLAAKHDAALVRVQKTFEDAVDRAPAEHWIWDGVHPTYSGHEIIANEWDKVVRGMK